MDKYARLYAYFLLFVTAVPALLRLLINRRVALLTSERMAKPSSRKRYRFIGILSIVMSIMAAAVYLSIWRSHVWLALAAAVGLISGAEMVGNTRHPEPSSLQRQNIAFGVLYAGAAVATYVFLLR